MKNKIVVKDRRKNSQNDIMKHIVNEANVINIMIQLLLSDLKHYIDNKEKMENGGSYANTRSTKSTD